MKRKITIIVSLALLIIVGVYIFYLHSNPTIIISESNFEKNNTDTFEKKEIDTDKLYYLEHIPIIYIEKDGYEAGLQHGKLLKQQIGEVANILYADVLQTNTIKGFLAQTYLLYKAKKLDKHIPQVYREEMKGIADGAEVSYNDILFINTYDDILHLAGCSSIAISKSEKDKVFIHARNLDYPIDTLSGENVIFHYLDQRFISISFPGYIGAVSATNYNGISLSSHTVIIEENKVGIPTGIIYRMIVQKAKTISEAENILKKNRRTIGNNLLVSSLKENKSTVFEITANQVIVRYGSEYSVSTNHFVSKELSNMDKISSNSKKRYDYLNAFFQNTENIDADKMKKSLSFFDGNKRDWSSIANKGTVQSVIFLPETKTIFIAKGINAPVNQKGYAKYEYSDFMP